MTPKKQYIAENGFITKEGWRMFGQTLMDIFIKKMSIEGIRQVVSEEEEIKEPVNPKAPVWAFKKHPVTCMKCGYRHDGSGPSRTYYPEENILDTTCVRCEHSWFEIPMDGSLPTFENGFEIMDGPQQTKPNPP